MSNLILASIYILFACASVSLSNDQVAALNRVLADEALNLPFGPLVGYRPQTVSISNIDSSQVYSPVSTIHENPLCPIGEHMKTLTDAIAFIKNPGKFMSWLGFRSVGYIVMDQDRLPVRVPSLDLSNHTWVTFFYVKGKLAVSLDNNLGQIGVGGILGEQINEEESKIRAQVACLAYRGQKDIANYFENRSLGVSLPQVLLLRSIGLEHTQYEITRGPPIPQTSIVNSFIVKSRDDGRSFGIGQDDLGGLYIEEAKQFVCISRIASE